MNKSILPKVNDMVTEAIMIEESYKMLGTPAKLILADYEVPEVGFKQEIHFNECQPISAHILIHDPPQPKLLKQLGWNIESDGNYTKPMLASIPRYLSRRNEDGIKPTDHYELILNKFTKVVIDYDYKKSERIFQVTDVSSNMFNPVFYYMKLVPYRDTVEVDPSPINDPNLTHITKDGQFKHLTFTPRDEGTKQIY